MDTAAQASASLTEVLEVLGQGRFVEEATAQLRGLVKEMNRVAEIGGGKPKGKLTITLSLGLDRGIFDLEPSIKITTPASVRARTIMYSTADGQLSKNDTRQGFLPLAEAKDVSTRGAVRDVRDIRERQANEA